MLGLKCLIAFWSCLKDVHTELIQHKRAWMIKRGIVKGKLSVDSAEQRLQGLCPLMPEEVSKQEYSLFTDFISYNVTKHRNLAIV